MSKNKKLEDKTKKRNVGKNFEKMKIVSEFLNFWQNGGKCAFFTEFYFFRLILELH